MGIVTRKKRDIMNSLRTIKQAKKEYSILLNDWVTAIVDSHIEAVIIAKLRPRGKRMEDLYEELKSEPKDRQLKDLIEKLKQKK